MCEVTALGGETVRIASQGPGVVSVVIHHERFGAIARIRLDAADAALLAAALDEHSGTEESSAPVHGQ